MSEGDDLESEPDEEKSEAVEHMDSSSSSNEDAPSIEIVDEDDDLAAVVENAMDADDGETAAGGRLLSLLELTGCMDVVVVVSRWYGGVLLGPDRFRIFNNVARKLLVECGHIVEDGPVRSHKADREKKHGSKKRA